jgi:Tfp pilus assembly PilM family ATPase
MSTKKLGIHYLEGENPRLDIVAVESNTNDNNNVVFKDTIVLDNVSKDMEIVNPQMIAHQIKLLYSKYQFKPAEINYSITSDDIFMQTLILPKMKKKDLDESIMFELSTTYPNFADNYSFSIKTIANEQNTLANYIVFCPFSLLKSLYGIGAALDLPVRNVTFSGNSLYLINKANSNIAKDSNTIIINLTDLFTIISVIMNGECISYQCLDIGLDKVYDEITTQYNLNTVKELILNGNIKDIVLTKEKEVEIFTKCFADLLNAVTLISTRHQFTLEKQSIYRILLNTDSEIKDRITTFISESLNIPCNIVEIEQKEVNNNFLIAYASCQKLQDNDFKFSLAKKKVNYKQPVTNNAKEAKPKKEKSSFWSFRLK